jgi:alginate O-acetyltransferase complex protein AlgI
MFFNSIDFAIFLPTVFIIYWLIAGKDYKFQNYLLLGASYYFYSCWDFKFLFLLIFSTLLDYFTGLKIFSSQNAASRKAWLFTSLFINLGFLGFFKYYNFFTDSFTQLLQGFGLQVNPWTLTLILPVGISFYTFHGMSYVLDIYNKKAKPTTNFIDYSLFVSFFPLLVAGPIERATHLLPQIQQPRSFNSTKAADGLRQILWGLVKKIVIADKCAVYVNMIFDHPATYTGSTLIMGAILFAIQIYGDFSGYSDIALGTARLFGFELFKNFAYPYFSRDIAEFWRRWHISLSSWFKDYLYIPLGGSKGGLWMKIRNTFIIFLVSGFWHGANWTFLAWGALHAIYFLPLLLLGKNRSNLDSIAKGKLFPTWREILGMLTTFSLTTFAWIFFRSPSIHFALQYIKGFFIDIPDFTKSIFSTDETNYVGPLFMTYVALFFLVEWLGREQPYAIASITLNWPRLARLSFYYLLTIAVLFSANSSAEQQFIYFQF